MTNKTPWHNKINWSETLIAYWLVLMMVVSAVLMGMGIWKLWEVVCG